MHVRNIPEEHTSELPENIVDMFPRYCHWLTSHERRIA